MSQCRRAAVTKNPHAGRLKAAEAYSLSVLEAGSSASRCRQCQAFSEGSWEECFLASCIFWWILAIRGGPRLVTAQRQSSRLSSHGLLLSVSLCLGLAFSSEHQAWDSGPILLQHDLVLTQLHLHRSYFQIGSHYRVSDVRTSTRF